MFRAISVCMSGNEDNHLQIRANTEQYMRQHFIEFSSIAEKDPDENLPFNKYQDKIAWPHQMVEDNVLGAVTNDIQKSIKLYYCGSKPQLYFPVGGANTNANREYIC